MSLIYDKGKVYFYLSHGTTYDSWPKTTETCRNFPSHYSLMECRLFHIPWGKSEQTFMFLLWITVEHYQRQRLRIRHKYWWPFKQTFFITCDVGANNSIPKSSEEQSTDQLQREVLWEEKCCKVQLLWISVFTLSLHILDYCQSFSALISCELHCKYFIK